MTIVESLQPNFGFLAGGGEMGALIRAHDWSTTPLGPPRTWPQSLRSAVSICLHSSFPTAIYWGPELCLLYNDAWAPIPVERHPKALGCPAAEIWADIWAVVGPQFERVLATGEGFSTFDQMLPIVRGGEVKETYWNYSFTPIRGEDGSVAGVFNQGHETTARVLAERQKAVETERLRRMFDQAPGFMAMLRGPEHVFELANAAYMQLVGHREVVGKTVREALPEVAGQGFFELLDNVIVSGQPFVGRAMPVDLQRMPGGAVERRFIDIVYQPITGANGILSGIFVEGSDVTERMIAEAALRESEARFHNLADNAPVMVWVTDLNGVCTYLSRSWFEFTGQTEETGLGFGWLDAVHQEDRGWSRNIFLDASASRKSFRLEYRLQRADGAWRWAIDAAAPRFGADGTFLGYVGSVVDITERKEIEEALQQANETLEARVAERTSELAAANRQLMTQIEERERVEATLRQMQRLEAVDQLTSGVAHDFNNLLTVVLGNIGFVERGLAPLGADAKLMRRLDNMRAAAERGAKLTAQLLAFARRQRLEPKPIDLNEVVAGMRELLASTLGGAVRLETILKPSLWPALVDPTQIELVILNLAINARDAMEVGSLLKIETSNATLHAPPRRPEEPGPGEYVVVCVSDTGTGMTDEVLAKAFEPFFTTKEVGKGSGLGLAQVYGFAKQSGGGVRIDSRPGEGTTIKVYLPRAVGATVAATAGDAAARVAVAGTGPRPVVLLVDDDGAVREVTASLLEELGYAVIEMGSGGAALEVLNRAGPIDLLLVDFAMPGMNGAEVAREAAVKRPGLPVLFLTGYADLAALKEVDEDRIVQKPFRDEDLAARIAAAVAGRRGGARNVLPMRR